ncbi:MAG: winged helix DNA-binding protein [Betaproteobacteria bacterium]|nr:winged helix DNA-binding protein [Betaproteobacteria bacterium]
MPHSERTLKAFRALRRLRQFRDFERAQLGLTSYDERDLICEIGHSVARGRPLTMKQAFLLGIGSVATTQRRIRRLARLGLITQRRSPRDRRILELRLTPKLVGALARWDEILATEN